jgi:hypothetical protein
MTDGEVSIMRRLWPTGGCCATETKKKFKNHFFFLRACPNSFPSLNATGKPKTKRKGKVQVLMACGRAQLYSILNFGAFLWWGEGVSVVSFTPRLFYSG